MKIQYSHSRVTTFQQCPYKFKLRYIDKLETAPNTDPWNPLICGNTIHTGAEHDLNVALEFYKSHYPIITDLHINEMIKFEILIPKIKELLDCINIHSQEYKIDTPKFRGIVDLITQNPDGTVDVFDLKYSNNVKNYMESSQLHVYKYFLEKEGFKVNKLGFIFIPKTWIRQKKTEDLYQFRKRLIETVKESKIQLVEIKYDESKVEEFFKGIEEIEQATEYPKNIGKLCGWCEYEEYCIKGEDYKVLPKNERRNIEKIEKKVMWWYGAPFTGKTYLANKFPDPLMLNTDGNIKFVDAPYLSIKDTVKPEGRLTHRTLAWENFKNIIAELEKKQNDFKTIIVDLLEDTHEHCRIWTYNKHGIEHESDNSFKYYDLVRTEFLSTLKRLMNLDYENIILISHEDTTKDITKKTGDKITRIAPNMQEKLANKIAGMVDVVARIVVEEDGNRYMSFKTSDVEFGGGRLGIKSDKIPLEYDELMKVYENVNEKIQEKSKNEEKVPEDQESAEEKEEVSEKEEKQEPKRRTRRSK